MLYCNIHTSPLKLRVHEAASFGQTVGQPVEYMYNKAQPVGKSLGQQV